MEKDTSCYKLAMTFIELQEQALSLSIEERWQLVNRLMYSLQPSSSVEATLDDEEDKNLVQSLVGIAKTDGPAPTDEEVRAMLDERLVEKYLS